MVSFVTVKWLELLILRRKKDLSYLFNLYAYSQYYKDYEMEKHLLKPIY